MRRTWTAVTPHVPASPPGRRRNRIRALVDARMRGVDTPAAPLTTASRETDVPDRMDFTAKITVSWLAAHLPQYTAVIGAPATSTTGLLAQIAGQLHSRSPRDRRIVVLDPKGDAAYMVSRYVDRPAENVDVLSGPGASIEAAAAILDASPVSCDLLIDNAWSLLRSDDDRATFESCLRHLRRGGHRVVVHAHSPDDLPVVPEPELFCVFALLGERERWERSDWATHHPELAQAGVFLAARDRGPAADRTLFRCTVVPSHAAHSLLLRQAERRELCGFVDVGREPEPPRAAA